MSTKRSNRELQIMAEDLVDLSGELARELDTGTLGRITELQGAGVLRASGAEAVGHGGLGDNTPDAALGALGDRRVADLATVHRGEFERCLVRAVAALRRARTIARLYPVPQVGNGAERASLGALGGAEPGCQSCARLSIDGRPRWEPISPVLSGPTYVGDRLAEPMLLCRWCYTATMHWGRLPTVPELAAHHEGRRVRWPDDVPRPRPKR